MDTPIKHKDFDELCSRLGDDIDQKSCNEIKKELSNCPECTIILDEIHSTVNFYRKSMPQQTVPAEVVKRLKIKLQIPEDK